MRNMYLIGIDECGDEVVVDSYYLSSLLDEDEFDIWKNRKIAQARERYPEYRGFYLEDRRGWGSTINAMIKEGY